MSLCNPQDFMIPEFKETATIGAVNYNCIQSELTDETQFTNYGAEDGATLFLDFVISDLAAIPEPGVKVTFRSVVYRVVKATPDSANLTVKISLLALNSGR